MLRYNVGMVKNVAAEPFIDEVEIHVRAGRGGDGCVHFRREKYVPKGGPDGGDGGKGGDVVFQATTHVNTLNAFRSRRDVVADDGKHGGGGRCTGASGKDLVIDVPVGTLIYDRERNALLADMDQDGARFVVVQGGKGGLGNWHFKSSVTQAPRRATAGADGEALDLCLDLRLLADVALVGFPNAGKSSLIRTMSRARPKVADYPFTTLVPNLGVVSVPGGDGFVVADIPGLIQGASDGAGLGHQFLRHISRARVLVHVMDLAVGADVASLLARHETIVRELEESPVKIDAPVQLLALNKADLVPIDQRTGIDTGLAEATGVRTLWTSTASGEGVEELIVMLGRWLQDNQSGALENPEDKSAADRIWGGGMTRWVVKVGSGVLADSDGSLRMDRIASIADQIIGLRAAEIEVVLVSSGAVAAGFRQLGYSVPPDTIHERQACASVGQVSLVRAYGGYFHAAADEGKTDIVAAGLVLLTHEDVADRKRYLNGRRTIETLIECGAVPVVNENDTVAVEEILMGDNDRLAAMVAAMIGADELVLLTNVDGLFETGSNGELQALVPRIDESNLGGYLEAIGTQKSLLGRGGMRSKLEAAQNAASNGIRTRIANGNTDHVLLELLAGKSVPHTEVLPSEAPLSARRHWIRFVSRPRGQVTVDAGAVTAITGNGKSLLPKGVVQVQGAFEVGDPVVVLSPDGNPVARGLVEYNDRELARLCGKHSNEIEAELGYKRSDEVIHRDDLVLESTLV